MQRGIADPLGKEVNFVVDPKRIRPESSEVFRLLCDTSKYERLVGKRTPRPLREGIRMTIDWFTQAENLKKYKTQIYNV